RRLAAPGDVKPADGRISLFQRGAALARVSPLAFERFGTGKPSRREAPPGQRSIPENGGCWIDNRPPAETALHGGSRMNRLPKNGSAPGPLFTPIRFKDFDVSWAGPHPLQPGF